MKYNTAILDFGVNNLKSLTSFFNIFGKSNLIDDLDKLDDNYDLLVIPGNGNFGEGIKVLKKKIIKEKLISFSEKKKVLGICLGMQIFFNSSEEDKTEKGFGFINGRVTKIKSSIYKLPLLGWYDVNLTFENYTKKKSFFFNNSFAAEPVDKKTIKGYIFNESNKKIVAVTKFHNFYGLQFHPEKSSMNGKNLILKILNDEI